MAPSGDPVLEPLDAPEKFHANDHAWYGKDPLHIGDIENYGTVGQIPRSDGNRGFYMDHVVRTAYKDTDQEVTDATLVNDSELVVTLSADVKYQFRLLLFFLNDGAAEGIKVSLAGTVGIVDVKGQVSIYDDTLNALAAFGRITALGGAGIGAGISSGSNYAMIEGAIETTTPGTFLLQFAQNAAGANSGVHCEVGSSMTVTKLE